MSSLIYRILWWVFTGLLLAFFRFRTYGEDLFPGSGGVIVAANHASYSDIPVLGCAVQRRIFFLGRANLFPYQFFHWALRRLGWIPLRTHRLDRKAFGEALSLLVKGKPVVIFPEGGRTEDGSLQPGRPGIGYLVAESHCQVIPAFISGTFNVLPPGARWPRCSQVSVTFGKPISFPTMESGVRPKEFYERVGRTVMEHIAELEGEAKSRYESR